jgi:hypothetical protein
MVLQAVAAAGSVVRAGTPVAEFDRQYMLNRLEDYEASVLQMEASFKKLAAELDVQRKLHAQSIENAKAALEQARLDVKMMPVLGRMDAERVRLAEEEAEARYNQLLAEVKFVEARYAAERKTAEYELQVARLELKRARAMVDHLVLKAPINGLVVMQTMFRSGEMAQIQAGDQLYPGMMFMQVVDPSSMVINATVNQVDAESIRVGAKAKVRIDAFPGLELPARVHAVGAMTRPGGYRAAFVKEIPVQLKLDQMDPRVIPDLSVSADVILEEEPQATVAPLAAVFQDNPSGPPFVFVRSGLEWTRREVQLGLSSFTSVAVQSGLQPGDVVAVERPDIGGTAQPSESKKDKDVERS